MEICVSYFVEYVAVEKLTMYSLKSRYGIFVFKPDEIILCCLVLDEARDLFLTKVHCHVCTSKRTSSFDQYDIQICIKKSTRFDDAMEEPK